MRAHTTISVVWIRKCSARCSNSSKFCVKKEILFHIKLIKRQSRTTELININSTATQIKTKSYKITYETVESDLWMFTRFLMPSTTPSSMCKSFPRKMDVIPRFYFSHVILNITILILNCALFDHQP